MLTSAYKLLIAVGNSLQSPFLLLVRLFWGWQFFIDGKGKLSNFDKVVQYFTELNIPFPAANVAMVSTIQMVGGLLLIIGLASRLTAVPLIVIMSMAFVTAESEAFKSLFSDPDKFLAATPFLFLFACVIILVFGPGKLSIDHLLAKKFAPDRQ